MAYADQTISNPVTGELITFLQTTEDTQEERLLFDCRVGPHGVPLPPHIHTTQEEHLEIVAGTLGVMLDDQVYTLRAGQDIVLPRKFKHQWWNAGRDEVSMRVEVIPPRHLEIVLEAICGMAHDGKIGKHGMPRNPFHLANLVRLSETYAPGVPIWIQRIALTMASWLGRLLGYDATFTEYQTETREFVRASGDRPDAA